MGLHSGSLRFLPWTTANPAGLYSGRLGFLPWTPANPAGLHSGSFGFLPWTPANPAGLHSGSFGFSLKKTVPPPHLFFGLDLPEANPNQKTRKRKSRQPCVARNITIHRASRWYCRRRYGAAHTKSHGSPQFVVDRIVAHAVGVTGRQDISCGVVGHRRDFAELVDGLQGPPRSVGEGTGREPLGVYRAGFQDFLNTKNESLDPLICPKNES
jgi:hypothetical protein